MSVALCTVDYSRPFLSMDSLDTHAQSVKLKTCPLLNGCGKGCIGLAVFLTDVITPSIIQ